MLSRIRMGLRSLFDRRGVESEMAKEMRLHLEMETEANIRRGMSPAEARRAALVAFGGVEKAKEATRDERATRWLDDFASDVRGAFRGMRKARAFTLTVVALVALGTGANTAIFSAINQLLLNPIPFPGGHRMVMVRITAGGGKFLLSTPQTIADEWRARGKSFEALLVSQYVAPIFGDTSAIPATQLVGAALQPGAMWFVGMRPQLGRDVIPADTLAGAPPVAILGDAFWRKQFGSDPAVIGKTILLAGQPHVVIGVAPPDFMVPFGGGRDVFTALQGGTPQRDVDVVALLKPDVSRDAAIRELRAVAPPVAANLGVAVDPPVLITGADLASGGSRLVLLLLFGAVSFVLLIACANVANLLLARAWSRQREFAVRQALGAGRLRLMRQVLTESVILASMGGVAGLITAVALQKALVAAQPAMGGPGLLPEDMRLDFTVFGWTTGVAIVAGIFFGIAPALFAGNDRTGEALKSSARSVSASRTSRRLRGALVVAEVAISVLLLAGAGLLVRTLVAMQRADVGMETRGLAAIELRLNGAPFKDPTRRRDALTAIRRRLEAVPGVTSVSLAMTVPPNFGISVGVAGIEGREARAADSLSNLSLNVMSSDAFRTAGIRLVQGRAFRDDPTPSDIPVGSEIVINERFARRFWPNGGAIGARLRRRDSWVTIVGIARDVDIPGARGRSPLQYYEAIGAAPVRTWVLVRSTAPVALLEANVRAAVKYANASVKALRYADVDADLASGRAMHRFVLAMLGGFAVLALIVAGAGLHAVIAYSVAQRRREMGIRVALGAISGRIAGLVVRQALALCAIGVALGLGLAAIATRAMRELLYGVQPGDPLTSALVALALIGVAMIAAAVPAWRAARIDPVEMLRAE
jgi:predicted permease